MDYKPSLKEYYRKGKEVLVCSLAAILTFGGSVLASDSALEKKVNSGEPKKQETKDEEYRPFSSLYSTQKVSLEKLKDITANMPSGYNTPNFREQLLKGPNGNYFITQIGKGEGKVTIFYLKEDGSILHIVGKGDKDSTTNDQNSLVEEDAPPEDEE